MTLYERLPLGTLHEVGKREAERRVGKGRRGAEVVVGGGEECWRGARGRGKEVREGGEKKMW